MISLLANAGTPLMWYSFFHLTVGNALIGLGEGLLLGLLLRRPILSSVAIMVLANYFSMITGAVILDVGEPWIAHQFLGNEPLYHARTFIVAMVAGSYVLSILLEWPFVFWIVRGRGVLRSFLGSVAAQTASYVVLIIFYSSASTMSVFTQLTIDRNLTLPHAQSVWVYYIASDRHVWRIRPDGTRPERVSAAAVPADRDNDYLWVRTGNSDYDLMSGRSNPYAVPVVPGFARISDHVGIETPETHVYNDFDAMRFGGEESDWTVRGGAYAFEGLDVSNQRTGQSFRIALETPFYEWLSRDPTLLPGDYVIYSLGGQIVLLDLNARRIRLVTLGTRPLVVIEGPARHLDFAPATRDSGLP